MASDITGTPGPWFKEVSGMRGSIRMATICAGRNHYGDGPETTVANIEGMTEADERMMIAAPEMYEALEKAREFIGDLVRPRENVSGPDIIATFGNGMALLPKLSAALRKARGEA